MKLEEVAPDPSACHRFLWGRHADGLPVTAEEMLTLFVRAGRVHGPGLLFEAWNLGLLDRDTLCIAAAEAWTMAEYPEQTLGRSAWVELFTEAGFTINGAPADRPSASTRLYRGAPKERRRRMAWSSDWFIAARFATGYMRQLGTVWMVDAPPESLLAVILDGREEAEYVVDTRGIKVVPGPDVPP